MNDQRGIHGFDGNRPAPDVRNGEHVFNALAQEPSVFFDKTKPAGRPFIKAASIFSHQQRRELPHALPGRSQVVRERFRKVFQLSETRLVLDVEPNPLVAVPIGDDLYELKFDIIMREDGGVGVTIEDFTVEAIAFKTVTVHRQTFPATYITDRGYPAHVDAGKYLRFSFTRRWQLSTRLLLSGATARITARTVDDNGVRGTTAVRIGVVTR